MTPADGIGNAYVFELELAVDLLTHALQTIEWGFGEGCPDCGATGKDDDTHRACCLVWKALYDRGPEPMPIEE